MKKKNLNVALCQRPTLSGPLEKATAMVILRCDKGYPAVRFEYKTASERYLVAEI